jgi:hypothetical protein
MEKYQKDMECKTENCVCVCVCVYIYISRTGSNIFLIWQQTPIQEMAQHVLDYLHLGGKVNPKSIDTSLETK